MLVCVVVFKRVRCTCWTIVILINFVSGYTPLMVAADLGDSEALIVLLEAGASVNCRVRQNHTCKIYFHNCRPLPALQ